WKLDLQQRYGKLNIQFGYSSTPVLDRGRLYLQLIHGDGSAATQEARLFCLDAATGSEIWKASRDTGASRENEHSYASPTIYRDDKQEYLISHGGDYVMANSLSDGSELWRYCLNPQGALYHPTLRFVSSPLATPGMIVAPSAKKGPIVCIKPEARGDISQNTQALHWRWDKGTPDVPSPLFHDGLVYLCLEDGILFCIDAETGAMLYQHRTTPDRHRASPVYADGKLYVTARNGIVDVVRAGSEFELLAKNDLGESMSASPVIANGRIYLRTYDALYAIGKK
ncbi:MAG: PQQ-binding-like beta-propeller repeat protein, partial [Pirellulaceae bacterium]